MAEPTPIGIEIVERVAAREGVDPADLDTKLYDVIDPDALEALTNCSGDGRATPSLRIEFTYQGYDISVGGTGAVTIDEVGPEAGMGESSAEGIVSD